MKTNKEKFDALPQRQKKHAKTKTALLQALLHQLEHRELSSIMIKELAKEAEVSEPTFFNYFSSKEDMLVYFIQIWSIEMQIIAQESEKTSSSYLGTIKQIFVTTAEKIAVHPQIMLEIIAFQAKMDGVALHTIGEGEKWLFFEEVDDVEKIEGVGLEGILPPLIAKAVKAGELTHEVDEGLLFLMLSSLFFGTSLLVLKRDAEALPSVFEGELDLLFDKEM